MTGKRWVRAGGISDSERVLRERVQHSTGIVEEFEGPVTGVNDSRSDLEVIQFIDINVGGRRPDGQTGNGGDGRRSGDDRDIGDEDGEGSTKGRGEH